MAGGLLIKGRYEVRSVLGRGGMGVVYRAYDDLMRREVALKTLRDVPDGVFIDLFYRECSVLAGMVHPNVVEVFDMGEFEEDGVSKPYFVMPLLPGQTLYDLLYPAAVPLSALRGVDIISQCCRGLQAAHDRGLLHRDIKPRNIFVMRDDAVKVIDFGVAHLMGSNSTGVRGTPQYMSPEQISFKPLSNRSDVFSLATVAYEALTATHPFVRERGRADSDADIAFAITAYNPPSATELNPGVSRAVSQAIAKAMAKDPRARFESATAFADALQRALRNEGDTLRNDDGRRTRLARARRSFEKKDLQFAAEILTELEAEGHSDPEIRNLRQEIDAAIQQDRTERLIAVAHQYFESEEYTLALKKVHEVLEIIPSHQEGLALSARIETVLTEQRIAELLSAAKEHLEKSAFTNARQAAQDVLKLRPNDTRARQVLSQVDAKQKELLRYRQEQERLFQAAQAEWLGGKIEEAIASLESLAELTRRSNDNRERVAEYKDFYRRVRQEHDELKSSLERAARLLGEGDPTGAQQICDRYIAKYPEYPLVHELARNIVRYREEEQARYQNEIAKRLEAEPLLEERAKILEEALALYPKNAFYLEQARNVRKTQQRVGILVNDARLYEKNRRFAEAVERWRALGDIFPAFPNLAEQIERTSQALQQQKAEARLAFLNQIEAALSAENYSAADAAFNASDAQFAGDHAIQELKSRRGAEEQRSQESRRLLEEAQRFTSAGQLSDAVDTFAKAVDVSRGLKISTEKVAGAALKEAEKIVGRDWRAAQAILDNLFGSGDADRAPVHLRQEILSRKREEYIRGTLEAIAVERRQKGLPDALSRAQLAAREYPGDARIDEALRSIEGQIEEVRRGEEREKCLATLAKLRTDFERGSSTPDIAGIQAEARALAAPWNGDAQIEEASREVIRQTSRYAQASGALNQADLPAAQSVCLEELKKKPDHQLFLALSREIKAREQRQAAEYLAQVKQRLASESLLENQAAILREAVQRWPGQPYYTEQIELVRIRLKLVQETAARAMALQRAGSLAEACEQWKYLATIYPYYPGLADAVTTCTRTLEEWREASRRKLVEGIEAALGKHDYQKALDQAQTALRDFAGDSDLLRLRQTSMERRDSLAAAQRILAQARSEFKEGDLNLGLQTVRDALHTAIGTPRIASSAAKLLLEHAQDALLLDLSLAEAMISEAIAADSRQSVPPQLTTALEQARRQYAFERCSASVQALEASGDVTGAIAKIREFLAEYPAHKQGEALDSRLRSTLEARQKEAERAHKLAQIKSIEERACTATQHDALLEFSKAGAKLADQCRQDPELSAAAQRLTSILAALVEIRALLDAGQFRSAEDASAKAAEQFRDIERFKELLAESSFLRQDAAAEYLRETERKLAAESDFYKQAEILNCALETYPEEGYYRDELQLLQNKQALLDAAVARARELELRGLYEDAKLRWEDLGKLYPWFSQVPSELERISRLLVDSKSQLRTARLERITALLDACDYESAQDEVKAAALEFPGDDALGKLTQRVQTAREQEAAARDAFWRGEELVKSGRVEEACASLRTAFQLASPKSDLKERVISILIAAAEARGVDQWRDARIYLEQAVQLQPSATIPTRLAQEIDARRKEEEALKLLDRVTAAEASHNWDEALGLLGSATKQYPGDERFGSAQKRIELLQRRSQLERERVEAIRQIENLRSALAATTNNRHLKKVRTAIEKGGWLRSQDKEIREAAAVLVQDADSRLAAAATRKTRISPTAIVFVLALIFVAAALSYFFFLRTPAVPVDMTLTPEQVTVRVGSYSCVTPACTLKLAPGHYAVQLSKDGFDPVTLPLDINHGQTTARLVAMLTSAVPLVRITANLNNGVVTLDGSTIGDLHEGHLDISAINPGKHVLALSESDESASIPFDINHAGQPVLSAPPSSTSLTVIAVDQSEESGTLAISSRAVYQIALDGTPLGSDAGKLFHLPKMESGDRKLHISNNSESFDFSFKVSPRPALNLFVVGKANVGALLVTSNAPDAKLLLDRKPYGAIPEAGQIRLILPVGPHTLQAVKEGYSSSDAVRLSVSRGSETSVRLELTAQTGSLDIAGAAPGTQVQVDHVSVGVVSNGRVFRHSLPAGEHKIDLVRPGFATKELDRRVRPGEVTALTGSDVALTPATPNEVIVESTDWDRANSASSIPEWQAFLQKHPSGPHASLAAQKLDGLQWTAVDKNNVASIQDYLNKYPQGSYADQARKLLNNLEEQRRAQAENADWNAVDKTKADALKNYLSKHPGGAHSQVAQQLIDQLAKPKAADASMVEDNAWSGLDRNSRAAVESFIARYPTGKHRAEAETALAALDVAKQQAIEAIAITATLRTFAAAWDAKDIDAIISAQPALTKKDVRERLSGVRSMRMAITPLSQPTVNGNRATVPCQRLVTQTYSDGTVKQTPSSVTFILEKRAGRWVIDSTQ